MVVKIIREYQHSGTNENYIKAMSNLIINKKDYNFNGDIFPPKIQCPNQFKKCPCLVHE